MRLLEILAIAVGLAMDASAVSLAAGAAGSVAGLRPAVRLAFHFGLFQAMMPVIGWFAGAAIAERVASFDHWIAFALLALVGGRMIRSALDRDPGAVPADPSRGLTMVALSVATSIDALAVGFSLAMLEVEIWQPSVVIGVVTGGLSFAGIRLGARLGRRFGRPMELLGGLVLIGIGIRIVLEHLS